MSFAESAQPGLTAELATEQPEDIPEQSLEENARQPSWQIPWALVISGGAFVMALAGFWVAKQLALQPESEYISRSAGPAASSTPSSAERPLPRIERSPQTAPSTPLSEEAAANRPAQAARQSGDRAQPIQGLKQPAQAQASTAAPPVSSVSPQASVASAPPDSQSSASAPSTTSEEEQPAAASTAPPPGLANLLSPPPPVAAATSASATAPTVPIAPVAREPVLEEPSESSVAEMTVPSPSRETVTEGSRMAAPEAAIALENPSAISPLPAESESLPEAAEISEPLPETPQIVEIPISVPEQVPEQSETQIAVNPGRRLRVTGNTVFTEDELQSVISEASERLALSTSSTLTTADLVQLSDAITQHYIDRSYISSGAYVSVPETANELPELRILEGRLGEINIDVEPAGLFSLRSSYIAERLRAATQGPLNLNQLVERVQLLEQDPLIDQITTDIVPGLEPGSSTLNVAVIPDDGFDVQLSTNTYNSPSIGRFGQQVGVSQANLLGIGDRLSIGLSRSEGSDRWNLGYSLPLNLGLNTHSGLLSFDYSDSSSRIVEAPLDDLDIVSDSQTYEVSFRQPLIRTPTEEFALSLSGYHSSRRGAFLEGVFGTPQPLVLRGSDNDGVTRISALRFGQEWIKRSPQSVFALQSEFGWGVNVLDATINDDGPDGRFLRWRSGGQWTRRLGKDSLWLVRGGLQLADGPLVPSEQFGVGGQTSVRGYRPNALLTDNGWLLSSEVRLPILRSPNINGLLQIAPFIDLGGGWNNGAFDSPDPGVLSSTGLGLIWQMGDNFDARLDWGVPLSGGQSIQDSGIQFQINFTPF